MACSAIDRVNNLLDGLIWDTTWKSRVPGDRRRQVNWETEPDEAHNVAIPWSWDFYKTNSSALFNPTSAYSTSVSSPTLKLEKSVAPSMAISDEGIGAPGVTCDSGWSEYNKHCYRLSRWKFSWSEANQNCKQSSANLASIQNQEENNFVKDLIKKAPAKQVWIGLRKGRRWKWSDGARLSYRNWSPGEPNNSFWSGREDCGSIYTKNIDLKQFGGLPGKSTTHCLVDILHHLTSTADRRVLYIDGHALQDVSVAKLLGVMVQSDLRWNTHVNHITSQSSNIAQIEDIQRRACRITLDKDFFRYSDACSLLGLPLLQERRQHLILTFGRGLMKSLTFREREERPAVETLDLATN
ncbi:hypothetical protein Bbelb_019640 [Branchiostoma belcheri]|nr:hypothetical protein Bbelb_019640 [Branchiostoma belcheri]